MRRATIYITVSLTLSLGLLLVLLWLLGGEIGVSMASIRAAEPAGIASPTVYSDTATFTTQAHAPPEINVSPGVLPSTQCVNQVVTRSLTISKENGMTSAFNIVGTEATNMELLLHFDEPAGATTFYDASGNDNHGSCSGASCPTAGASGKFGQALSFDGVDDYVEVSNSCDLGGSSFTVGAWIYRESGTERKFISKWNDNTDDKQFDFQVYSDSKLWFEVRKANSATSVARGTTTIEADQWYYVTAVADTQTQELNLYVNGVEETLQGNPGWDGTIISVNMELNVGRKATGNHHWYGLIDEVVIYGRALSAEEVEALYLGNVLLTPRSQTNQGGRGEIVAHEARLTNATGITEGFSLTLGSHIWDSALSLDSLGPMTHSDSVTFTVYVTVPVDAGWYLTDTVAVTATSVASPTVYSDTATFTTQAYAPPQISVSPDVLTSTQYVNQVVTKPLTISNGSGVTLTFEVAAGSVGDSPLEGVLDSLNSNYQAVIDAIPNRYDFSEGETGTSISDGGDDMYDGGNYLSTNLGGDIEYSSNAIVNSSYFGSNGRYFTRKYPGLFVLVADLEGVGYFQISGNLGADGGGNADGTILQTNLYGTTSRI